MSAPSSSQPKMAHRLRHTCSVAASAVGRSDNGGSDVLQMPVSDLRTLLQDPDLAAITQFIDVREPWEEQEANIPEFTLLPLSR